jgi:excisionase family DNA binding protein
MQTSNLIELLLETFEQRTRQIIKEELASKIRTGSEPLPISKEEKPIRIDELAKELGVTRQTIHNKKRKGEIPFHRLGGRIYFFRSEVYRALRKEKESHL